MSRGPPGSSRRLIGSSHPTPAARNGAGRRLRLRGIRLTRASMVDQARANIAAPRQRAVMAITAAGAVVVVITNSSTPHRLDATAPDEASGAVRVLM